MLTVNTPPPLHRCSREPAKASHAPRRSRGRGRWAASLPSRSQQQASREWSRQFPGLLAPASSRQCRCRPGRCCWGACQHQPTPCLQAAAAGARAGRLWRRADALPCGAAWAGAQGEPGCHLSFPAQACMPLSTVWNLGYCVPSIPSSSYQTAPDACALSPLAAPCAGAVQPARRRAGAC